MATCLVALGSNLGEREQVLAQAVDMLGQHKDMQILERSRWYQSAAVGGPAGQGAFLNGVLTLATRLAAPEVHAVLKKIEKSCGRRSSQRWAARILDLDLLLYDDLVITTRELTVPHPRMAFRRFVLAPADEIAPDMVHPMIGWSIHRLLENLNRSHPYIAVTGLPGAGQLALAEAIARDRQSVILSDQAAAAQRVPAAETGAWSCAQELARIPRRAALIATRTWPQVDRLTLSTFWFEESLAYAELCDNDADRKQIEDAVATHRDKVVRPRLIVFVDPPLAYVVGGTLENASGLNQDLLERLRSALSRIVIGAGPVLHVQSSDPAEVIAEVMAAIDAMSDRDISPRPAENPKGRPA